MRRDDLLYYLWSAIDGPCVQAHYMKRYAKRARSRYAAYEKSAKAYLGIASRGREPSKIEEQAMLRWEEERSRIVRRLGSQDVSMKSLMLATAIKHFCGLCSGLIDGEPRV